MNNKANEKLLSLPDYIIIEDVITTTSLVFGDDWQNIIHLRTYISARHMIYHILIHVLLVPSTVHQILNKSNIAFALTKKQAHKAGISTMRYNKIIKLLSEKWNKDLTNFIPAIQ